MWHGVRCPQTRHPMKAQYSVRYHRSHTYVAKKSRFQKIEAYVRYEHTGGAKPGKGGKGLLRSLDSKPPDAVASRLLSALVG